MQWKALAVLASGLVLSGCETTSDQGFHNVPAHGEPTRNYTLQAGSEDAAELTDAQYLAAFSQIANDGAIVSRMNTYRELCPSGAQQCQAPNGPMATNREGVYLAPLKPWVKPPLALCVNFQATGGKPSSSMRTRIDEGSTAGWVCRNIRHSQDEFVRALNDLVPPA